MGAPIDIQHVMYNGHTYAVKTARLNMTSATTTSIVDAVAGKRVMVLGYQLGPVSGATTVTIQDDAGTPVVAEGPFYVGANGGIISPELRVSTQMGTSGQAMQVVSSAAVNLAIKIWYIEV